MIISVLNSYGKQNFPKLTSFLTILPKLLHLKVFSTHIPAQSVESKCPTKAVLATELLYGNQTHRNNQEIHLGLIQDFVLTHSEHFIEARFSRNTPKPNCPSDGKLSSFAIGKKDKKLEDLNLSARKVLSFSIKNKNPILGIVKMHREGLKIDVAELSYALSACRYQNNLCCGTQLQGLAIRDGFSVNVYIGSALISMYAKYGYQHFAFKVFEEMPVKNIVSWTALISGFAQECQADKCLELYIQMRKSSLKPNEFTFTSLLSACVGSGFLVQGKGIHCQSILWGTDSYAHVANALISMYCKCGDVQDAFSVFNATRDKDIITWNSMIAGYALHGLAKQAIDLFEEMIKHRIKPDGITFLGVLSSCRHAGLVNEGRFYFDFMREHGVMPDVGHYSCIVDLLGRVGLIVEARNFILKMPIQPNAIIWGSLLSSCRLHDYVWIGIEAAESRLALEPSCAATHVQLAKLYGRLGMWDQVARVRKRMKDIEVKTNPGYSWIEIGKEIYRFGVNGSSNFRMNEILSVLDALMDDMEVSDHTSELK